MFCDNCGKPIPDGKTTCDECLAALNGHSAPAAEPAPAPVATPAAAPAPAANGFRPASLDMFSLEEEPAPVPVPEELPVYPVLEAMPAAPAEEPAAPVTELFTDGVLTADVSAAAEAPAFELNTVTEEPPKKKKRKKGKGKWIFLSIVALVLVVATVLAVLNWNAIVRFFKRTFTDPTEYLVEAEQTAMEENAAWIADAYGAWLDDTMAEEKCVRTDMTFEISDKTKLLLAASGSDELDWLDSVDMTAFSNLNGDRMQVDMCIGMNSVDLVTLSFFYDAVSETALVGMPELNGTYVSLGEENSFGAMMAYYYEELVSNRELAEKLPTAEEIEALVNTYYGIILDHVKDVQKETKTVELGGLKQEMLVLTVEFSYDDLRQIAIEVLTKAKDDPTVKKLVDVLSDCYNSFYDDVYYDDYYYVAPRKVDLYETFVEYIDQWLVDLEEAEADDDKAVTMSVYLDNEDSIVGRCLTIEDSGLEDIYYLTVTEGEEFAFEAVAEVVKITGSGKTAEGETDAQFKLLVDGSKYATLVVKDLRTHEDGAVSGTFRLSPGSAYFEELGIDTSFMTAMGGMFSLELEVDNSGESTVFEFSLLAASMDLFTVRLEQQVLENQPITLPADTVSSEDSEAGEKWVRDLDVDGLVERMRQAGLPEDVIEGVRELFDEMLSDFDTEYDG